MYSLHFTFLQMKYFKENQNNIALKMIFTCMICMSKASKYENVKVLLLCFIYVKQLLLKLINSLL